MKAHRHGGIYNNRKLSEDGKENVPCMHVNPDNYER